MSTTHQNGIATNGTGSETVSENVKVLHTYLQPGMGAEKTTEVYNKTCNDYETWVASSKYTGPRVAAETVARMYPSKQTKILDVAAGTGLGGVELKKRGYTNLDALDPSQGMLDLARQKNCYKKFFCAYVNEKPLDIPDNHYDVVVIVGGMGENAIPSAGFLELTRIIKPGGRLINVTRSEHFRLCKDYVNNLSGIYKKLEDEKKWVLESETTFPEFLEGKEGITVIHRIL